MLVYNFVPFIVSNPYLLFYVSNGHNSVTVLNRTHVYMNLFHHKDLRNHLLQLCPKVVKHPVYTLRLFEFRKQRHKNVFYILYLFLSVRLHVTTGEMLIACLWIWVFWYLLQSLDSQQFYLNSSNNCGHLVWTPAYILLACRA